MTNFKLVESLLLSMQGFTGTLDSQYIHLGSTKQARNLFEQALKNRELGELDEIACEMETESERQGFVNGFRMGVQMMCECLGVSMGGGAE